MGEDDDASEQLRSGPLESIAEVRRYLKYDLASELEAHERVQRDAMNEATYTAIVWEAVQRRVGPRFRVELDRCVPGTNLRADVLLYRDRATGVIAIEVKLKAQTRVSRAISRSSRTTSRKTGAASTAASSSISALARPTTRSMTRTGSLRRARSRSRENSPSFM